MKRTAIAKLCAILLLLAMTTGITAEEYINDVLKNKITVCKFVRLAVQRHVDDLERSKSEDFPYYFDRAAAERKIRFSQELRHTKGEWAKRKQKIKLEPWEQFIDWAVYGWKKKSNGTRRFTKAYVEVARKNGKTTYAATGANHAFLVDGEEGAEVYCIATKKDQAKVAWNEAERQIQKHPFLKKKCRTYKQNSTVVIPGTATLMRPLGADSDTEDGLNPHFVLVDEYHAHKNAEMLNVMESGMGARSQPLIFIITTAGKEKQCACYQEERALVVNILEKNIDPVPENIFGIIFTLDDEDDWLDEKVWVKSNPNLGVSLSWDYLRKRVSEALASPEKQNDVKTKNLNIWTQAETRWISSEAWKACPSKIFLDSLKNRVCYGAFDLSTNIDLTAWVLCFPPLERGGEFVFLYRFFMPNDNILERQRRDRVPYMVWTEQGYITATDGNVVDYDFIEAQILRDAEIYRIVEIAYDRWNATEISNHLQDKGLNLIQHGQGFASMSGPSKIFEEKVLSKKINHGGNPVMTWMVSCTEIKSGEGDLIKPSKPDRKKTGKRIDGVMASIMALGRAVLNEGEGGCGSVAI